MPTGTNLIGWGLALIGGACAIAAAAMQGGWVAGLGAASAALTSLAGAWGYANKPVTPPVTPVVK